MNAFTHPQRRTNMKKTMLMTLAATTAATAMSANLMWVGGA